MLDISVGFARIDNSSTHSYDHSPEQIIIILSHLTNVRPASILA